MQVRKRVEYKYFAVKRGTSISSTSNENYQLVAVTYSAVRSAVTLTIAGCLFNRFVYLGEIIEEELNILLLP